MNTINAIQSADPLIEASFGSILKLEMSSVRVIDDVKERFSCHTKRDSHEIMLDGELLKEKEKFYLLCEVLNISPLSAAGVAIKKADYIVFHMA